METKHSCNKYKRYIFWTWHNRLQYTLYFPVYVQRIYNRKLFVHNGFYNPFKAGDFHHIYLLFQSRIQMDRIVVELSGKTTQVINKMAYEGAKERARGERKQTFCNTKNLSLIWFLNRNCKNVKMISLLGEGIWKVWSEIWSGKIERIPTGCDRLCDDQNILDGCDRYA